MQKNRCQRNSIYLRGLYVRKRKYKSVTIHPTCVIRALKNTNVKNTINQIKIIDLSKLQINTMQIIEQKKGDPRVAFSIYYKLILFDD
jgi:hypothetical protein